LHDRVNSIDPAVDDDHAATRDRVASLVFETLTGIDAQGNVVPKLASSWRPDAARRGWQFRLRISNLHACSPVTAADCVASLNKVNPNWKCTAADRQTVNIEASTPVAHMAELLSLEKYAIVKRAADNTLAGSGPFRLNQWQAGDRAVLSANDDYWAGR